MSGIVKKSANEVLAAHHEKSDKRRDKILCVDDSKTIREMVQFLIPHCVPGFKVVTARDGEEAFKMISEGLGNEVAIVFSDVNMPRMDGLQLAHEVKSGKLPMQNVPFIICSGSSGNYQIPGTDDYKHMQGLMEKGLVDKTMGKPFIVRDVQNSVVEAVNNVRARNSLTAQKSQ